jgi:hypothetical protein
MASFGLVHHFEVLVRNAIDGTLGEGQPQEPIRDTWLVDFGVIQPEGVRQVINAIGRLRQGKMVTRGRIVAGLPFSFWADLFGHRYEDLWRDRLHGAFSHRGLTRKALSSRMSRVRRFRNRIAHHDSLLDQDVPALVKDMLEVSGWIDPDARVWLEAQTGATEIARQVERQAAFGRRPSLT